MKKNVGQELGGNNIAADLLCPLTARTITAAVNRKSKFESILFLDL